MDFQVKEAVVLATIDTLPRKAEEAIDLVRKFNRVRFECEGVSVKVFGTDLVMDVQNRWLQDYNFFGLTRVQRRSLYELCVVEKKTPSEASETARIHLDIVMRYIRAKGWSVESSPPRVLDL